jgi:hypothetical protein
MHECNTLLLKIMRPDLMRHYVEYGVDTQSSRRAKGAYQPFATAATSQFTGRHITLLNHIPINGHVAISSNTRDW